jgi:lambda repressor-like predicted transcriptional regulator
MARPVQRVYLGIVVAGVAFALLAGAIGLWFGLWLSSRRPTRIATAPPSATGSPQAARQPLPGTRSPSTRVPPAPSTAAARAPAASGRASINERHPATTGANTPAVGKPAVTASRPKVVAGRPSVRETRTAQLGGATLVGGGHGRAPGGFMAVKPSREEEGRRPAATARPGISRPSRPRHPRRAVPKRPLRQAREPQMLSGNGTGMGPGAMTIPPQAEPLMIRALSAYHVTDDAVFGELRRQGWSFADMATAGNLAARSRHSLPQITRAYQARHNWAVVAREVNVPPDEIYRVLNAPRAVLLTGAAEEAPVTPARRPDQRRGSQARRPPQRPARGQPSRVRAPAERVAGARLELTPRTPAALLHRAVATYYALPPATMRGLEAGGWTLGDFLVAGNLTYRSEASFEEIAALRDAGQEWETIARQIGVAPEDLYRPASPRRVTTFP